MASREEDINMQVETSKSDTHLAGYGRYHPDRLLETRYNQRSDAR